MRPALPQPARPISIKTAHNALISRASPAYPTDATAHFGIKNALFCPPGAAILRLPSPPTPCGTAREGCFEEKIGRYSLWVEREQLL